MVSEDHNAYVNTVASHIQAAAGAVPYATVDELVDIFARLADRVPEPRSALDRQVLQRLFETAARRISQRAGADPACLIGMLAAAPDPRAGFKAALAALRPSQMVRQ